MKKAFVFVLVGLLAGAALMYVFGPARLPNRMKPAEPTSFAPVAAHLDSGGDLYGYLSTEKLIRSIEGMIGRVAKGFPIPIGDEESGVLSFIFNLIGKSGLKEISGAGLSNVGLAGGLQRTRMVIHHYPENNTGLMWQAAPTGPRTLSEIDLLPADTALAAFGELKLDAVWAWLKKELEASGIEDIQKVVGQVEPTLAAQGVDLPKLLASLSGPIGYIVTLDREKTIELPGEAAGAVIPEPGFALVFGTKDETFFDLVKTKLPMASFSEQDGRKMLQFQVFEVPIRLEPCLIADRGFLIAATNPDLAESLLQARSGKGGLVGEAEFKELRAHVPSKGNGFSYMSPRLWKIYADIVEKAASTKPEDKVVMDSLFSVFPRDMKAFAVMEHRYDGIIWTSCHNLPPATMALMPLTAATGLAAAMAAPALAQAGDKAKVNETMTLMKTCAISLESYITDKGTSPQASTWEELRETLAPYFVKDMPLKDAWGHDILYKKTGPDTYLIASPGKDGEFNGWNQKGEYPPGQFDEDIIVSGWETVYGPIK
ncbi:MAG: type II secretion system protein GspG [Candidatus Aminicenantes bacterium]|nr:type II secretion system protein GspG [Candidatus Aminicenantes bacterium]